MTITASIVATRATGVAPLGVSFDATGTSSSNQSDSLRKIDYFWDFGDPAGSPVNGTTWAYGAFPGVALRNEAKGPIVAHMFENGGTFTVTLYAYDGTEWDSATTTITVDDPDTFYSGTNTHVVSNGTDFTGKPTGATEHASVTSWATVLGFLAQNRRVLLKRGDVFTFNATTSPNIDGPWTVGAWGSGAKPVIRAVGGNCVALSETAAGGNQNNDWRWMDLEIDPNGQTNIVVGQMPGAGTLVDQLTYLRISTTAQCQDGIYGWESAEHFIVDCSIKVYGTSGTGYSVFWNTSGAGNPPMLNCAIMGCDLWQVNGNNANPHLIRIVHGQKIFIANNNLRGGESGSHVLKLVGADFHTTNADDASEIMVSQNKFIDIYDGSNGPYEIVGLAPVNESGNARIRRCIVDGNWFVSNAKYGRMIFISGEEMAIRNNLFDYSVRNTGADNSCILLYRRNVNVANTDDILIYNNTLYSSDVTTGTHFRLVEMSSSPTNVIIRNNLLYTPSRTDTVLKDGTEGTGYAASNNTADADTDGVDPVFVGGGSAPANFKIQTTSPYKGFGTSVPVFSDAFGVFRPQSTTWDAGMAEFDAGELFPWENRSTRFYSMSYARTLI